MPFRLRTVTRGAIACWTTLWLLAPAGLWAGQIGWIDCLCHKPHSLRKCEGYISGECGWGYFPTCWRPWPCERIPCPCEGIRYSGQPTFAMPAQSNQAEDLPDVPTPLPEAPTPLPEVSPTPEEDPSTLPPPPADDPNQPQESVRSFFWPSKPTGLDGSEGTAAVSRPRKSLRGSASRAK